MRYYFLITLAAFMSIIAWPLHAEKVLAVVWAENGNETYFAVANSPVITVSGSEVFVNDAVDKGNGISLKIAELDHFELKDVDITPVEDIETTNNNFFRLTGNGIEATGLQQGETLWVYDTSGRLVSQVQANAQGCASIALGRGVYVIKANNRTFKIAKR